MRRIVIVSLVACVVFLSFYILSLSESIRLRDALIERKDEMILDLQQANAVQERQVNYLLKKIKKMRSDRDKQKYGERHQ